MGRPSRYGNNIEGRPDTPVEIGKALGVDLRRAKKQLTRCRHPIAFEEHIGGAHRTKIMHQLQGIVVADGQPVLVDHRQRETGALEERSELAEFCEWGDPGRSPAGQFRFGDG